MGGTGQRFAINQLCSVLRLTPRACAASLMLSIGLPVMPVLRSAARRTGSSGFLIFAHFRLTGPPTVDNH